LASATVNLNKFDGLLKVIDASYSAANVNAQKIVGTVATTSGSFYIYQFNNSGSITF
jgi:hypothetical protein